MMRSWWGGRPEILQGGVANAGAVVREGHFVLRPANARTPLIHALLRHVRSTGFGGVPEPVGIDADGRERLIFVSGEVAVPPFPAWIQRDDAVASIAELLGRFHEAAKTFEAPSDVDVSWSDEMADPAGGTAVCHNDVCPGNVVFRQGRAIALLDFDFAGPGRALYDLAGLANMCVPLDTAEDAAVWGWGEVDPFRRLRAVADGYGLGPDREQFVEVIEERMSGDGAFVQRRAERGEPAFVDMWERMGGGARYARRLTWFRANREHFLTALG